MMQVDNVVVTVCIAKMFSGHLFFGTMLTNGISIQKIKQPIFIRLRILNIIRAGLRSKTLMGAFYNLVTVLHKLFNA